MSTHLVQCAALLPLKPVEKLVLLCLAENANNRDSIAFPGFDALLAWSCAKRTQVYTALKRLQEYRLIEQVGGGHRGKAAEYLLFPFGCCRAHGKEDGFIDLPDTVEASDQPDPVDTSKGAHSTDPSRTCGKSGQPDAFDEKGSGFSPERVRSADTVTLRKGPRYADPHQELPRKNIPQGLRPDITETATVPRHSPNPDAHAAAPATPTATPAVA